MEMENNGPVRVEFSEEPKEVDGQMIPGKVKHVEVKIGGRVIPLRYGTRVQEQVEEDLGTDFYDLQNTLNKGKKTTKITISAMRLMGNEGLRVAGEQPDLTDDWLCDHMIPAQFINYRMALLAAMVTGWYMETDNSYNEKQDVVLNEIRKKNESTESHTGS